MTKRGQYTNQNIKLAKFISAINIDAKVSNMLYSLFGDIKYLNEYNYNLNLYNYCLFLLNKTKVFKECYTNLIDEKNAYTSELASKHNICVRNLYRRVEHETSKMISNIIIKEDELYEKYIVKGVNDIECNIKTKPRTMEGAL